MRPVVYIRCDGGTDIGMGHVVRCLALAQMLREFFDIRFIVQETDNTVYQWIEQHGFSYHIIERCNDESNCASLLIDALALSAKKGSIVVLDGYNLQTLHQQRLKEEGYRVVAIDDLHAWHHTAEAIINHAPGLDDSVYKTETSTRRLLGARYALLRPALLLAATQARTIKPIKHFLISMGAADTKNFTQFFAEIIRSQFPNAHIHLLVSTINPNLDKLQTFAKDKADKVSLHLNLSTEEITELLLHTDVVICPASTISMEACATGCTLITGYTAHNQQGILAGLTKANACFSLGNFADLESREVGSQMSRWLCDDFLREKQMQNQRQLIDGRSGSRIALAFLEIEKSISVRTADANDAELYFQWANDADVRANSFQSEPIQWNTHLQWLQETLKSSKNALYLYSIHEIPAGQIRLKIEGSNAIISYSVGADFRGQGLGKWMLRHITLLAHANHSELKSLEGWVKKTNTASLKAFESVGFRIVEENNESVLFKKDLLT
jgi:UDP-2,4-diacetamido-2,4,6-trideoxy-beta-L-altropyranose hydrolase